MSATAAAAAAASASHVPVAAADAALPVATAASPQRLPIPYCPQQSDFDTLRQRIIQAREPEPRDAALLELYGMAQQLLHELQDERARRLLAEQKLQRDLIQAAHRQASGRDVLPSPFLQLRPFDDLGSLEELHRLVAAERELLLSTELAKTDEVRAAELADLRERFSHPSLKRDLAVASTDVAISEHETLAKTGQFNAARIAEAAHARYQTCSNLLALTCTLRAFIQRINELPTPPTEANIDAISQTIDDILANQKRLNMPAALLAFLPFCKQEFKANWTPYKRVVSEDLPPFVTGPISYQQIGDRLVTIWNETKEYASTRCLAIASSWNKAMLSLQLHQDWLDALTLVRHTAPKLADVQARLESLNREISEFLLGSNLHFNVDTASERLAEFQLRQTQVLDELPAIRSFLAQFSTRNDPGPWSAAIKTLSANFTDAQESETATLVATGHGKMVNKYRELWEPLEQQWQAVALLFNTISFQLLGLEDQAKGYRLMLEPTANLRHLHLKIEQFTAKKSRTDCQLLGTTPGSLYYEFGELVRLKIATEQYLTRLDPKEQIQCWADPRSRNYLYFSSDHERQISRLHAETVSKIEGALTAQRKGALHTLTTYAGVLAQLAKELDASAAQQGKPSSNLPWLKHQPFAILLKEGPKWPQSANGDAPALAEPLPRSDSASSSSSSGSEGGAAAATAAAAAAAAPSTAPDSF